MSVFEEHRAHIQHIRREGFVCTQEITLVGHKPTGAKIWERVLRYRCVVVAHACTPNCVGLVRPLDKVSSNVHQTHDTDPSDAHRSEQDLAESGNAGTLDFSMNYPLRVRDECMLDYYREATDGSGPAEQTSEGKPVDQTDAVCEPESSSASVSPTQLACAHADPEEKDKEGRKRRALLRCETITKRPRGFGITERQAHSPSASQEW